MPVVLLTETAVVCGCVWTIKMDPQKLPGVRLTADVGVFATAIQKKAVAGTGSDAGQRMFGVLGAVGCRKKVGACGIPIGDTAAAGEYDQKEVGGETAPPA